MKYSFTETAEINNYRHQYLKDDSSFDIASTVDKPKNATILVADTLQLEFDTETGRVLFLWGYSPTESWSTGTVEAPVVPKGTARVILNIHAEPGGAYSDDHIPNNITFDKGSGWVRIGSAEHNAALALGSDLIIGLDMNGHLSSIWVHPEFI